MFSARTNLLRQIDLSERVNGFKELTFVLTNPKFMIYSRLMVTLVNLVNPASPERPEKA
jgi:hypothetical protein